MFEINLTAFLLAALFVIALFFLWRSRKKISSSPSLLFPSLSLLESKPSWRYALRNLPTQLLWGALGLFLLAFIDPHFYLSKAVSDLDSSSEGIAIYLVLDQSGSMSSKVTTIGPEGKLVSIPKVTLLKQLTEKFVEGSSQLQLSGRPNDLIGLITFARAAKVISPLTLDHAVILDDLRQLNIVSEEDQDGTAIGYAIYKAANIIAATQHYANDLAKGMQPAYDIKSSIIILVTDGFHSPNPLDVNNPLRSMEPEQAAEFAKSKGVKVYIVNIEPALGSAEFAPHRHLMQRVAEQTGGKYYLMDSATSLAKIYGDIDQLEKSKLPATLGELSKDQQPQRYQRISLYPALIGMGLLLLLASTLLQVVGLRRIP